MLVYSLLKNQKKFTTVILIILSFVSIQVSAYNDPIYSSEDIFHPVVAKNGMVSSANSLATMAGLEVLKEGGNAVDAAVTVGFTLAVIYPRAGNLGGGGFMLIYLSDPSDVVAIDYREKAPRAASRDMFLDKNGNVDEEKSLHSLLSVGVPGTVAGLTMALEQYGTIPLKRALKPAIELAEDGFPMDGELRRSLLSVKERMKSSPSSMEIFFKSGGVPYDVGELFVQKDLAWSLKKISESGSNAFYNGEIAEKIATYMKRGGGLITRGDLSSYRAIIRKPVRGTYRGYEVFSMPPPSSGGVLLIEMLNLLEHFPLSRLGHNTGETIHLMVETMKFAFADRSRYLGDPDFRPIPVADLISKAYASALKNKIEPARATPSLEISPGSFHSNYEGTNTTHFSVIDSFGNAVSNTYTLNFSYGTKLTVPGTGILLNDEMDDFSAKPGMPNAYGLLGGDYNAIEPGKRMLSSMTPTIVMKDGKPYLLTGSPGGSRIITTVLQVILNVLDFHLNIAEATNAERVHHQWFPDEIVVEKGLNQDTIGILHSLGHKVVVGDTIGSAQSIMKIGDFFYGASDPRSPGSQALGY